MIRSLRRALPCALVALLAAGVGAAAAAAGPAPSVHPASPVPTAALSSAAHSTAALGTATPSAPATRTPAQDDPAAVRIEVLDVAPDVLRPGEPLVVRARVHNGTTAVAAPRVSLLLDRTGFVSRSQLSAWADRDDARPAGHVVASTDLAEPLGPGQAVVVELTADPADLRLPTAWSQWGPRGIAVELSAAGERLGLARTFTLWQPGDVPATRVSSVVPLVADDVLTGPVQPVSHTQTDDAQGAGTEPGAGAGSDAGSTDGAAGAATDSGQGSAGPGTDAADADADERLTQLLRIVRTHHDTALVVDPSLLLDGAEVAQDLLATTSGRDVFLLPYADADLAALAHAEQEILDTEARRLTAIAAALVGSAVRTDLAWPADDVPDLATVRWAARHGARSVLVGSPGLAPVPELTYTPTGRTTVPLENGAVTALIADGVLSELFTDPGTSTPAVAAQRVLAETAVITRERPADSRHVLVTLPRDWSPDPEVAIAQLAALEGAPWVSSVPLTALLGTPDPDLDRTPLPERSRSALEATPTLLEDLAGALDRAGVFASVIPDPEAYLTEQATRLLRPLSVSARGQGTLREAYAEDAAAAIAGTTDGITFVRGSVVNLISSSGELPVGVRNDTLHPVEVVVRLVPDSRALTIDSTATLQIPPGGQTSARVPVRALASDDVDVAVEILNADGRQLRPAEHFTVRVRADWEGVGTAIIGGLLGVGVVVGLWRSIKRGRLSTRASRLEAGR